MASRKIPVKVINYSPNGYPWSVLRNEARNIYPYILTTAGVIDTFAQGNLTKFQWAAGAGLTAVATNTVYLAQNDGRGLLNLNLRPGIGRTMVIFRMEIQTSRGGFELMLDIVPSLLQTRNSNTAITPASSSSHKGFQWTITAAGTILVDFGTTGLVIRGGETGFWDYCILDANTVAPAIKIVLHGHDLTNDDNYTADKTMLVIGDSICVKAETLGVQTGLWAHSLRDSYLAAGKSVRLVNMGIEASLAVQWENMVNQGIYDYWRNRFDILFINLGINDATSNNAGSAANYAAAMTGIINKFSILNPNAPIVVNNINPSDLTAASANIAAYRSALVTAITTLQGTKSNLYFVDTSAIFSASSDTYFQETGAGNHLHPNTTQGQPLMASAIWTVAQNLI